MVLVIKPDKFDFKKEKPVIINGSICKKQFWIYYITDCFCPFQFFAPIYELLNKTQDKIYWKNKGNQNKLQKYSFVNSC